MPVLSLFLLQFLMCFASPLPQLFSSTHHWQCHAGRQNTLGLMHPEIYALKAMNIVDRSGQMWTGSKLTELTESHRFGCSDARPVKALFHISFRTLGLESPTNFIHVQHSVPKSQTVLQYLLGKYTQAQRGQHVYNHYIIFL